MIIKDTNMNINNAVDKAYESKSLKEIADAPISALQGLTQADADLLKQALGVKTIKEFGSNKFVKWAQAIAVLADTEA
jgi:hypothetical protein